MAEQHQKDLISSPLNEQEQERVQKDLAFIDLATKKGKELGLRVIFHGGYAVDGNLGKITRSHKDIDMQVYGTNENAISVIASFLEAADLSQSELEDKGRSDFYHNVLVKRQDASGIDLYYLQVTTDPFSEQKVVVKADGSLSESHDFDTKIVTLNGVTFEVPNPVAELADKIYKRDYRHKPRDPKYDQDIENLRQITNKQEVDEKVAELAQRK